MEVFPLFWSAVDIIKTKDQRTISQDHKNNKNFKVLLRYEQDQGSIDKKELGILNKDCTLLNHFQ